MSTHGESQVTLVNPEADQYLELVLSELLTLGRSELLIGGQPRYKVSTEANGTLVEVTDLATKEVIASYKRRSILSDKVTFPRRFGGKPVSKDSWMTRAQLSSGKTVWVIKSESGKFLWKLNPEKRITLTAENAADHLIAYVKEEKPEFSLRIRKEAESNLDEILLAFAILESKWRKSTNWSNSIGGDNYVQRMDVMMADAL